MTIKLTFRNDNLKMYHNFYIQFINFLYDHYPLSSDLTIIFLKNRNGKMTTGVRLQNELRILTGGRMNRDILRTLAHEWIHEYQMTVLNRKMGPNIGGKNEDEANAISARLIKLFEKKFPNEESLMYE